MGIALITGGSRGIGFGIAQALASEKWDLIINGVRPAEEVSDALDTLRTSGSSVRYAQGDVGTQGGRESILKVCAEHSGGALDLLVNNAGVAPKVRADLLETSEDSYDRLLDINLKGAFFLTQAVARTMVARKKPGSGLNGMIVNITSISSTVASINRGEYCIAKAGLSMMTRLFATRLGPEGIPVFEVRPGVIRTDMTAGVTARYDKLIGDGLCVQPRWGEPADVGRVVAALARGDFGYSTGQVLMVDGGLTIPRL